MPKPGPCLVPSSPRSVASWAVERPLRRQPQRCVSLSPGSASAAGGLASVCWARLFLRGSWARGARAAGSSRTCCVCKAPRPTRPSSQARPPSQDGRCLPRRQPPSSRSARGTPDGRCACPTPSSPHTSWCPVTQLSSAWRWLHSLLAQSSGLHDRPLQTPVLSLTPSPVLLPEQPQIRVPTAPPWVQ